MEKELEKVTSINSTQLQPPGMGRFNTLSLLEMEKINTEMTNRDIVKLLNIKNDVDRTYKEGAITPQES